MESARAAGITAIIDIRRVGASPSDEG
jgi:hypothetical protein